MREIILNVHITLDGVTQSTGGPDEDPRSGFSHGGWTQSFNDAASGQVLRDLVAGDLDLLLGRRTYEIFATYWPDKDNWIATAFNEGDDRSHFEEIVETDQSGSQKV